MLEYDGQRRLQRTIDSIGREVSIGYQANITTITEQATGRTVTLRKDALTNLFRSGYSAQTGEQLFPNLVPPVTVRSLDPLTGGYVLASIDYPNGQSMRFRYNSYGEVARIDLATGGAYEYDWANFQGGTIQIPQEYYNGITTFMVYRRVVERRVYNSGTYSNKYRCSERRSWTIAPPLQAIPNNVQPPSRFTSPTPRAT